MIEDLNAKRVLVTGVCGFIGHHLAKAMLMGGWQVIGMDNLDLLSEFSHFRLTDLQQDHAFTFIHHDIRKEGAFSELNNRGDFDLVIHLAARTGVLASVEEYSDYIETNVTGSCRLFDYFRASQTPVLFASSSSVYGESSEARFSETDLGTSVSIYAATKKSCEEMANYYANAYQMRIWAMRFFTVYGPFNRQDMAVYKFIDRIYNQQSITVYHGGRMRRDFTFVQDIVQGISALGNKIMSTEKHQSSFETFNIAYGQEVELMNLISAIETNLGRKAKLQFQEKLSQDVMRTSADISKIKSVVSYNPQTSIEAGIKACCEWYLSYKNKA